MREEKATALTAVLQPPPPQGQEGDPGLIICPCPTPHALTKMPKDPHLLVVGPDIGAKLEGLEMY